LTLGIATGSSRYPSPHGEGIQQADGALFGIRPAVGPSDAFDFPVGVTVKKARDQAQRKKQDHLKSQHTK
jgi:hypothetical protein